MWVMPSSTASRSTATAASRSAGGPNTCGPASCIAPYPIRVTMRSPARANVPPASVVAAMHTPSSLPRGAAGTSPSRLPATASALGDSRLRSSARNRQNPGDPGSSRARRATTYPDTMINMSGNGIDPRTPVVVGVGQASERLGDPGYRRRSPVELAADAALAALEDTGADESAVADAIDTVAGVPPVANPRPGAPARPGPPRHDP